MDQNGISSTQMKDLLEVQSKLASYGNESLKLALELDRLISTSSTLPTDTFQSIKSALDSGLWAVTSVTKSISQLTSLVQQSVALAPSTSKSTHEWKSSGMVGDLIRFLDNVLEDFIRRAPEALGKAVYSAMRERSVGLGAMGFHGLLQSEGIAWESWQGSITELPSLQRDKGSSRLKHLISWLQNEVKLPIWRVAVFATLISLLLPLTLIALFYAGALLASSL